MSMRLVQTEIAILAVGFLLNVAMVLCLAHTWKYWRQVKRYIILLAIGNFLHVTVTQGTEVAMMITKVWMGSSAACRFLVFMVDLGPSLSAMAVAALAVHVLLTSITGCQGNKLRHFLVLGLFLVLSLPLPLAKIPLFEKKTYSFYGNEMSTCQLSVQGIELELEIGESVALVFFPLFIWLAGCVATGILFKRPPNTGTMKSDHDKSDLVLTVLLGLTLLVFCFPPHLYALVSMALYRGMFFMDLVLRQLVDCRCIASALVIIVFSYAHVYRKHGEIPLSSGSQKEKNGERQKLVN